MAHNAETNRYRGLRPADRATVLEQLRAGATPHEAAEIVGKTARALGQAADGDGELRAALDGHPPGVQVLARQLDYLAALVRCAGDEEVAARALGLPGDALAQWRSDDVGYAQMEDRVRLRINEAGPSPNRTKTPLSQLERAAGLLENGHTLTQAAKSIGVTPNTLRNRAEDCPRLQAALPPLRKERGTPNQLRKLTPTTERRLRAMWPHTPSLTEIALRLDISLPTLRRWEEVLVLPWQHHDESPKDAQQRGARPRAQQDIAP
ncbi:hypothetical protein ACTWQF_36670 [Streptomyces sp. 8N114]|uniref:hypothetical protein n=1 Tax=Streptomyces sp. 8N114 TaxID=3457419 RepID=UPI003FD0E765